MKQEKIGITIDCKSDNSYCITTYNENSKQMISIKQNDNREIVICKEDLYKLRQCLEFIGGYHHNLLVDYPQCVG